jgi:hypothetical protein
MTRPSPISGSLVKPAPLIADVPPDATCRILDVI